MVPIPTLRRRPRALPSLLLTALLATQAQAQPTTTTAARPDPLDPKAQVPAMRYESSLGQSRRSGDDKPLAWRDANDAVARIGGWRVYAREAQQPDAPPSTPPAVAPAQSAASTPTATTKPAPAGHGGHKP